MNPEQRRRTRVDTGHEAVLTVDSLEVTVRTLNLSLKGALTTPAPFLAEEQRCRFSLILSPELRIEAEARVVRSDNTRLALEFTRIEDESFPHLLRLVELHAEDAEIIERELAIPAFEP